MPIPSDDAWERVSRTVRRDEQRYGDPTKIGHRRKRFPEGSGSGGKIITFEICEACCLECWADVSIISKSFTGAVPGAGATERACDLDGYDYGEVPGDKVLPAYQVRVYDILGCRLTGPNNELVGRKGRAIYMTRDGLDCEGDARAAEFCGGYSIPSPRWEISDLCCAEDSC